MAKKSQKTKVSWKNGLSTTVYQGGNYYYHFMSDGKLYEGSTGCQFKKDAENWLRAYRTKLALQKVDIKKVDKRTFKEVFEEYMHIKRNEISAKYVKNITECFKLNVLPFIGDSSIAQITSDEIKEALNKYLDKGRSKSGYNVIMSYIRTIMNYADKKEYLHKKVPEMELLQVQEKKKPVLREEHIIPFLKAIDDMNRPKISVMVRAMLYFGLRENEARLMKWSNFDFKEETYTPDKTKNYQSPSLAFPSEMVWHLNKLKQVNPEGNDWVILGYGKKPVGEQYARNAIALACATIGVSTKITNHRLRASFITLNARNGTDRFLVKEMARHASFKTTEIYLENEVQDMKKASDNLWNKILQGKKQNIS